MLAVAVVTAERSRSNSALPSKRAFAAAVRGQVGENFPLAKRVSLAGEAFFSRNLGGFHAGVFQSYNNEFAYQVAHPWTSTPKTL